MNFRNLTAALLVSIATFGIANASAKDFSKEEIESIIHDYIVNHPEVLIEAQDKVEIIRAEKAKQEKLAALEKIYANKQIPRVGPANAKHKIVEFFDYNCGYCKKGRKVVLETLKKHNDVEYIYLEFPILSEISYKAAEIGVAIYAIDKTKYKKYNDELMSRSERLSNEIQLQALVEELGLNWGEVKKVSDYKEVKDVLKTIREFSKTYQVTGTPAFIIDGELVRGAPTSEKTIEAYLTK